ncbi:MAG: tetratricopeptide repeat protein, partial [Candidatus Latescibacterota bacterium]
AEKLEWCRSTHEASGDASGAALSLEVLAFVRLRSDPERALRDARESLRLRRELGDRWGIALAHYTLGWVAERRGLLRTAARRYRESLRLRRELGEDPVGIISCLNGLGRVQRNLGDAEGAGRMFEEGLRIAQGAGGPVLAVPCLGWLGILAYERGDAEGARRRIEEALPGADELAVDPWRGILRSVLANVEILAGEADGARAATGPIGAEEMESVFADDPGPERNPRAESEQPDYWRPLANARRAAKAGAIETSSLESRRGLGLALAHGDGAGAIECLVEIAAAEMGRGDAEKAGAILGCAAEQAATSRICRARTEGLLAEARAAGADEKLEAAVARGRALGIEGAARLAAPGS